MMLADEILKKCTGYFAACRMSYDLSEHMVNNRLHKLDLFCLIDGTALVGHYLKFKSFKTHKAAKEEFKKLKGES